MTSGEQAEVDRLTAELERVTAELASERAYFAAELAAGPDTRSAGG